MFHALVLAAATHAAHPRHHAPHHRHVATQRHVATPDPWRRGSFRFTHGPLTYAVTPAPTLPPVWDAARCTVVLPDAGPGVIYALDFIPSGPGDYLIGQGVHEVTVESQVGYSLTGVVDWTFTVTNPAC